MLLASLLMKPSVSKVPSCLACEMGLPAKILVSEHDPRTKRTVGKTVDHATWVQLKAAFANALDN